MTTVAQAFQSFLSGLELTERERDEAIRQHTVLRGNLTAALGGVETTLLMGSYRRGTAIRPLSDIDVFVVLDAAKHANTRAGGPHALLKEIARALRVAYPAHQPRLQGRSVNVEFAGTGIGYDLVPAFASGWMRTLDGKPAEYEIPDRNLNQWIKTNPQRHHDACVAANERAGGMLNGLIKAVKQWNRGHGERVTSFHLEVMSYGAFAQKPDNPRVGLHRLFSHLQYAVLGPCPDPAGLGPNLDANLGATDRQAAYEALHAAVPTAAQALEHERYGDHAGACQAWRSLLGSGFSSGR
jgi:predicted nucleotidyltransferase